MESVYVAVDVEWIALAYGDVVRVLESPEKFKSVVIASTAPFGVKADIDNMKVVLYDAPRDASRGAIHQDLQRRGFELKLGHVMERKQYNGSVSAVQKGVDVMLTVDVMTAMQSGIDTLIILTSDTDFVPLLQQARFAGVKTAVIGRSGVSSQLTKVADVACSLVMD